MEAVIPNWPFGSQRATATFRVETNARGKQRGTRVTIDPKSGRHTTPKVLTYANQVRIVDGDDGRLYFIELTMYGHISVMQGTMQFEAEPAIFSDNPRYAEVRKLFDVDQGEGLGEEIVDGETSFLEYVKTGGRIND
jgi:hypothetical protein